MQQDNYWKCEYENLRRKKKKEIDRMVLAQSRFVHRTYDLLKILGLTDEMIRRWYDRRFDNTDDTGH